MPNEWYLAHYGIKGQKWGVRRFQNADGSLTAEGKARYGSDGKISLSDKRVIRKEYKADNKQAFEYGRSATISARTASYAQKKEAKAQKRYDRRSSEKNAKNLETAKKLRSNLDAEAKKAQQKAEEHRKSLVSKYGKEAVSSIKYDKLGRVNEKIHTGKDYWSSYLKSFGIGFASTMLGAPVSLVYYPMTKNQTARKVYKASKDAIEYPTQTWIPKYTANRR